MAITVSTMTPTPTDEVKETLTTFNVAPANGLSMLYEKAEEIQSMCSDTLIPMANLENVAVHANPTGSIHPFRLHFVDGEDCSGVADLTDYSFGQLCNKLTVPSRYMMQCYSNGLESLAVANLNTWIDNYEKDLLLRRYYDSVNDRPLIRGVLSSKYSAFDTPDIIDVLEDSTRGLDLTVKQFFLNYERFHARLIQNDFMSIQGEDLKAGIVIDSSDVGRSTLTVQFFIYKQICTNGLCISKGDAELFRQKHINISKDNFEKELSTAVALLPELIKEYEHIIPRVALQQNLVGFKSKKEATDKELERVIASLKNKTKLSDEGVAKVIDLADSRYGFSDWGVINSITEVAQDYTLERRIELERIAGDMLKIS